MGNLRPIAFHEAGHAIAARRFKWPIARVTIEPGDGYDGRVEFGPMPSIAEGDNKRAILRQRLLNGLVVSLAGPAAQRRVAPRSRIPASARRDYEMIERDALLLSATPQGERALQRWAEQEARALVRNNWPSIAAVADALVERTTITGPELDAITAPIEAAQAMEVRAHLSAYGLPTEEQVDQHRAERVAASRPVERRHIAEGVLRSILHRIGTGDQSPLSVDDLDAAVRRHAMMTGRDPDIAARKLWGAHARQAEALRWRKVKPTMALTSSRRH